MTKLHVGCASKRIEGYINVDCRPTEATDHVCSASDISIVPMGSVTEIYSRHMLEHLDPNEAKKTLLHWYALIEPGAFIHVIVPDIEFHAKQLLGMANSVLADQQMHAFAGFWGWQDESRGGSNEDAHRWGYTENSLITLLINLGFVNVRRVLSGVDTEAWHLNIVAYKPQLQESSEKPKVSVVISAYKSRYFEAALDSVLVQTYPSLEIIIHDDSADDRIAELTASKRSDAAFPIRYLKNGCRLGEAASTASGIRLAQGKYIKFLHDDDVLEPDCIAELVAVMEREPDIALVSSRRRRIGEEGEPLPDILHTCFPFASDVVIDGRELVSFLGEHTFNFIGEPSCVLAKREDLLQIVDQLMSLNGKMIHWVGDLALYAKLLQRGNLGFLARPLTNFRVSTSQFSQAGRDQPGIGEEGHADFRQAIRDLGWLRSSGDNRLVGVAPITRVNTRIFKPVDILATLYKAAGQSGTSLSAWLAARKPSLGQMPLIEQRLQSHDGGPRFGVLLLDRTGDTQALERSLVSLEERNLYRNIDVHVVSMADLPALPGRSLTITPIGPVSAVETLNRVIQELSVHWCLLADSGVTFTSSGLLMMALELIGNEECVALYGDELVRGDDDEVGAALRPDFNLDLLLSFPASSARHWLFRRDELLALGGFNVQFDEAFELEYILRLIEQRGLNGLGHVSEPLLAADAFVLRDSLQEREVIERHLQARGYPRPQVISSQAGRYQLEYGHDQHPLVSIVVPLKDQLLRAQRCVETVLENTDYPHYEILLLDLGSEEQATLEWLKAIEQIGEERIRVLQFSNDTSRQLACNAAIDYVRGEVLLWLDAGTAVVDGDWLRQLLNHALRPEVGAVGAKLLSADGRIHHAGLLLGLLGPAGRAFEGLELDAAGYMQRLQVEQNYSALSGECLMIRRELFVELGGFDQDPLMARWSDVDLCLKARQAGYLNVWTPRVQLLVDSERSASTSHEQEDAMYTRWLPLLAQDPAYNPNLSLQRAGGFALESNAWSWRPLHSWKPLPVVLAHPADRYGCGHYRVIQPFKALKQAASIEGQLADGLPSMIELQRYAPDTIILQRQIGDERLDTMRRMQQFSSAFKVYELDDYLPNLPMKSAYRQAMPKDVLKSLRRGLGYVDRLVVSTPALAEALAGLHEDIRVVGNRLPVPWWSEVRPGQRGVSRKPRVGWAGGAGHTGDLEMIADVVRELAGEVEWVFMGMCPESLRPYVHEFRPGVVIEQYPAALAGLNLDLALAPVEQNLFNDCKSNLRLLEYGACGVPVICSDVRCYREDGLPVMRVKNRFRDWVEAIRMHLADLDATARQGDELRGVVLRDWMLRGDALEAWLQAWRP